MARATKKNGRINPTKPFPDAPGILHQDGNWLWIPLRAEWRDVSTKPEEVVRQHYIRHLVENFGYSLELMDQERRTQHGHRSPRADIVIWETPEKKAKNATPILVIECKADTPILRLLRAAGSRAADLHTILLQPIDGCSRKLAELVANLIGGPVAQHLALGRAAALAVCLSPRTATNTVAGRVASGAGR